MKPTRIALVLSVWLLAPSLLGAQVDRATTRSRAGSPAREGTLTRLKDDRPLGTPPGGVKVSAVTPTSVTLSWQAVPGVLGYTVVKGPASSTEYLHTDPITATSFTHDGLAPNTTVQYIVFSEYGLEGQFKNAPAPSVSATTAKPVSATGFKASREGAKVTLNWTAAPGAAGYYVSRFNATSGTNLTPTPVAATTFVDAEAPAGEQRYRLVTVYGPPGRYDAPDVSTQPEVTITVPRTRGRYRVTINGFQAHQETKDHMLELDGKRDEVFVAAYVGLWDIARPPVSGELRTRVYGDVNGFPDRRKAGSASAQGGIRSGDKYPAVTNPWMRFGQPGNTELPLLVWEGDLVQGQNLLWLVPTIWEYDGESTMYDEWVGMQRNKSAGAGSNLDPGSPWLSTATLAVRPDSSGPPLFKERINVSTGEARDLPLGAGWWSHERDGHRDIAFYSQTVMLTVEAIEAALAAQNGIGGMPPGYVSIEYRNPPELGGRYSIYLQVERVR